jgi:hypothetical protein
MSSCINRRAKASSSSISCAGALEPLSLSNNSSVSCTIGGGDGVLGPTDRAGGGGGGADGVGPERSTPPVSKNNSMARSRLKSDTCCKKGLVST